MRASPDELTHIAGELARTLVQVRCSNITIEGEEDSAEEKRQRALIALLVTRPFESLETLNSILYSPNVDVSQRIMILDVMAEAARELANSRTLKPKHEALRGPLISNISDPQPWYLPRNETTPWKKVAETGSFHLNWANRFERELQPKPGQTKKGKTRRWSLRSGDRDQNGTDWSQNRFPLYAAAFMLPAMKEFDKRRHGVDLLGRDFVVLGKLVHMLGVCMQCASMHPEASALAVSLLDMLQRRYVITIYLTRSFIQSFARLELILICLTNSIQGSMQSPGGLCPKSGSFCSLFCFGFSSPVLRSLILS